MSDFTPDPSLVVQALQNACGYVPGGPKTYALEHAEAIAEMWPGLMRRTRPIEDYWRESDIEDLVLAARRFLPGLTTNFTAEQLALIEALKPFESTVSA